MPLQGQQSTGPEPAGAIMVVEIKTEELKGIGMGNCANH